MSPRGLRQKLRETLLKEPLVEITKILQKKTFKIQRDNLRRVEKNHEISGQTFREVAGEFLPQLLRDCFGEFLEECYDFPEKLFRKSLNNNLRDLLIYP